MKLNYKKLQNFYFISFLFQIPTSTFKMELTYLPILIIVCVSSASCSQSTFKLSTWKLDPYKGKECDENSWKCTGENKCVKLSKLCDGKNDCFDGSDESYDLCTKQFCSNKLNKWKCPGESKVNIFSNHI